MESPSLGCFEQLILFTYDVVLEPKDSVSTEAWEWKIEVDSISLAKSSNMLHKRHNFREDFQDSKVLLP